MDVRQFALFFSRRPRFESFNAFNICFGRTYSHCKDTFFISQKSNGKKFILGTRQKLNNWSKKTPNIQKPHLIKSIWMKIISRNKFFPTLIETQDTINNRLNKLLALAYYTFPLQWNLYNWTRKLPSKSLVLLVFNADRFHCICCWGTALIIIDGNQTKLFTCTSEILIWTWIQGQTINLY